MKKAEIPFSFLRDVHGVEVTSFLDRQKMNKTLRDKGVPISVSGLDVLISLWTLPSSSRDFDGLLEDMVTSPKTNPAIGFSADEADAIQRHHLESLLGFLTGHKMVKKEKERYTMTKKGQEIMEKAKSAIA
jgi:hypothetical protein